MDTSTETEPKMETPKTTDQVNRDALRPLARAAGLPLSWIAPLSGAALARVVEDCATLPASVTVRAFLRAVASAVALGDPIPRPQDLQTETPKTTFKDHFDLEAEEAQEAPPEPRPRVQPPTGSLEQAILGIVRADLTDGLAGIKAEFAETLAELAKNAAPKPEETTRVILEVRSADKPPQDIETPHPTLPALIQTLQRTPFVWLHGDSGAGKSHGAKDAARALGLDCEEYSCTRQTLAHDLMGSYSLKEGSYHYLTTAFYRCYTEGKLLILDEIDKLEPNTAAVLHSALSNGSCGFPNGSQKRHPNFRVVATGNTVGAGADRLHVSSVQQDIALRDRFYFIAWNIDNGHETKLAAARNPKHGAQWSRVVQAVRLQAKEAGLRFHVSPRASLIGADLIGHVPLDQIAEGTIWRGMPADQRAKLQDMFTTAARTTGLEA